MRIKVIIPVSTDIWNESVREMYERIVEKRIEFRIVNIEKGPKSIQTSYEEEFAAPYVLEEVIKAEKEGFDAVVIYCFSDPALSASRELVNIPVIGIGEAAKLLAMMIGQQFAIIVPVLNSVPRHIRKAMSMGIESRLACIKSINIPVLKLKENTNNLKRAIIEKAKEAVNNDGADTIILGCGAMLNVSKEIQRQLGVPVIDAGEAGLIIAESIVRLNLSQSKKAYGKPL